MDELDMLRAARPRGAYPDELRAAARDRLLTLAAADNATRRIRHAPRAARRTWRPWQAALAAGVAAFTVFAAVQAYSGKATHPPRANGSHQAHDRAPAGAAQVLLLAAKAAAADTLPPGTRWIVWEDREDSTAQSGPTCSGVVKSASASAYAKYHDVLTACPVQAPASLPRLRTVKPVKVSNSDPGYPDPALLPNRPGPLLQAIYRWDQAHYRKYADSLPGHPAPPLTAAGLHADAFGILARMLTDGITSPAPSVQLAALALIPGTTVDQNTHNAAAQPGIGVVITSDPAQTGASKQEIIFDPGSYADIGGVLVTPTPGGGSDTVTTTRLWKAYYDASGHRI